LLLVLWVDRERTRVYLLDMVKCGGCGRDMQPESLENGVKYLCNHCLYLHKAGREPLLLRSHTIFIVIALVSLAVVGLAGLSVCLLYLAGTGKFHWFLVLLLVMLCAVACPAFFIATKRRNITLLIASFYLPLGVWFLLWSLAPNVLPGYESSTFYGAFCFLGVGALTLYLFVRDMRALPRY